MASATDPSASAIPERNLNEVDLSPEVIKQLKERLTKGVAAHTISIDPIMFNGGTILVLVFTMLTPLLIKSGNAGLAQIAPWLAALAGVIVAAERALGFGARWRYHVEMRSSYESIIDMLEFFPLLPGPERPKYARDIFGAIYAVRSRESAIPNAGTNTAQT